ncbi:hypothetical protein QYE76_039547 [Lolium multiflorum]|uniref:Bifunctional inhibitor/plant lipid transfer protein/seed storage helical domain-containing protein n=1 Tax=Lolium multiflorum TaxID=4521 RepID=A0AAD8T9W2_LOLMU|nr:hypothetical protein QYE76_039547 [Lolium multiflorum]
MAPRPTPAFLVLSVLALASLAASQAPASGPAAPDCSSALTSLAGCLTYIQPGSPQSKPPKECCAGVKAATATPASVKCLCDALHTDYGVPLNMTRAAALPAACGASAAAFSTCNSQPSSPFSSARPPACLPFSFTLLYLWAVILE